MNIRLLIFFEKIRQYFYRVVVPRVFSLFSGDADGTDHHKVKNFGAYFVTLLSVAACQSSLWGAPPPPPTSVIPSASAALTFPPFLIVTPISTSMSPTTAPTPLVLNAAQVYTSPAVPAALRDVFRVWGFQVVTEDQQAANLYIDVAQPAPGAMHVSSWTYALVAPFPTLLDGVTEEELLAAWAGSRSGALAGVPILMEESTRETFTQLWGLPAANAVRIVPASEMLDFAWSNIPAWAIIPFEQIEPKWKVLMVDGQSPIQKGYDPIVYPLDVSYRLMCVDPCQVPSEPEFSFQNYDPNKLTTVILTGVTAMTRATARKMDVKGITYPGEAIRDMLREADITHINNEVPFYAGCPAPDPQQESLTFCSSPLYIELLIDIGTDVVELSGDHFADYRDVGMIETLDIYDQVGLPYYGGGRNVEDGRKPLLFEINGNKLMFIGCNYKTIYASATDTVPGSVPCDFDYMTEQIARYRVQGYLPIATFQYHEFPSLEARPQQILDFRVMADAGAVVVSGSQAHIPQVMELYQDGFIHYGLGNLFFDQMDELGAQLTQREFIDRHVFYDGRYLGVELITTFLEDYARPRLMTELERDRFLLEYFEGSGWEVQQ